MAILGTKKRSLQAVILLSAFTLFSCSKDKTIEEYQQEQATEDLALYDSIKGEYRGLLVNQKTGQDMGLFEIDLSAGFEPDGTGTSSRAALKGSVKLINNLQTTATIQSAKFYSPNKSENGSYNGTIAVPFRGGIASLAINGAISNGTFTGTIAPNNIPGLTARFRLSRGSDFPRDGQHSTWPGDGSEAASVYQGTTENPLCKDMDRNSLLCRKPTLNVRMTVDLASPNGNEAFFNNFADQKMAAVTLEFEGSPMALEGTEFDSNNRRLHYQGVISGTNGGTISTLDCNALDAGYRCTFRNSSRGVTYKFDAALVARPGRNR